MPIAIETGGIHPSTGLCLEALQWLQERHHFDNILDMGCGNGILSVAAAAVWDTNVLAVDISEKALSDTMQNVIAHGLERQITLLRSDGFSDPLIRGYAPYSLIICNMLAEFTVESAQQIQACLANDGICILAGILAWKAETVKTAYIGLDFEIIKEIYNSPWQAYVIRHIPDASNSNIVTKP